MSDVPIPEFGVREPGKKYVDRPGAYAVAQDHQGRFAAVEAYTNYFLLGGGIDPGEEPEAALLREVLEESGRSAQIVGKIGEAVEYIKVPNEGYFAIHATYFQVDLGPQVCAAVDCDHIFLWLSRDDAVHRLARGSARWAVQKVIDATLRLNT
jgi:8-oxo-dGTP diphosphatase